MCVCVIRGRLLSKSMAALLLVMVGAAASVAEANGGGLAGFLSLKMSASVSALSIFGGGWVGEGGASECACTRVSRSVCESECACVRV